MGQGRQGSGARRRVLAAGWFRATVVAIAGAVLIAGSATQQASSDASAAVLGQSHTRGRGPDDLPAVRRAAKLRTATAPVGVNRMSAERPTAARAKAKPLASTEGADCLSGDSDISDGCVIAQEQPLMTAPADCAGLDGTFKVQVGGQNPNSLVSYSYPYTASPGVVPSTTFADGQGGQTYSWLYEPSSTSTSCYDSSSPEWRTFRIDMIRAGIEPLDSVGPVGVGLASGAATITISSNEVSLIGGGASLGLSYRSPGGVGYQVSEPTNTLPYGWGYSGLGDMPPWVSLSQVGTGSVPAAVVLTAFDGQQIEFTNTLAGTSATGGAWAPPTQAGWSMGQFGTLVDSGDLTASNATFTWTSGQEVVVFEKTGNGTWGIETASAVQAGGYESADIQGTWDSSVSPARLSGLTDPVSGKTASFLYGNGSTCNGTTPPTDGSDVYYAPNGLLCGWTSFDGTSTSVWYAQVGSSGTVQDDYQPGWFVGAGGANTQLFWASDGGVSFPELVGVQEPAGYDTQTTVPSLSEADTTWTVNYDAFGNVSSIVSPLPGVSEFVSGTSDDRVGRIYTYNADSAGDQWATVNQAVIADDDVPTSVSAGVSIIEELAYDAAWRPLLSARTNAGGNLMVGYQYWDTVNDRLIGLQAPNGRMRGRVFDYLGRVTDDWGPGPVAAFELNSTGTGIIPAAGYGDDNLMHSTGDYDADSANLLTGYTVSFYASSTPAGIPASTVGSCSEGQCTGSTPPPLSWSSLPSSANVSGGSWSMNVVASRNPPTDQSGTNLQYRVSTDSHGTASIWVGGNCTVSSSDSTCDPSNTAAAPIETAVGQPLNLQVQYVRDGTSVSAGNPVTVTVEESQNGGSTWTTLASTDIDSGFGFVSSGTQNETLQTGGSTTTFTSESTYSDPEFAQLGSQSMSGGGLSLSNSMTYESYNANGQWGRQLTMTRPSGAQVGTSYYGDTDTANNPCDGSSSAVNQAGLGKTRTSPASGSTAADGDATTATYDGAGRIVAVNHIDEAGTGNQLLCTSYDQRGALLSNQTSDGTVRSTFSYPWDDPDSTNPFLTTVTHVAPNTTGASTTYTASAMTDLIGRTVQKVDVWGTTTTTVYGLDAATGVTTTATTVTSASGAYTLTDTTVTNSDGTLASRTRVDSSGTATLTESYNTDGTPASLSMSFNGTPIVTQTYGYDTTTGSPTSITYSQNGSTVASDQVTYSPNSTRALSDVITVGSDTYTFDYTYNGAGWLDGATLASSNASVSGSWDYTFATDGSAQSGENPDAYLNGNITQKSSTVNGTSATVDYHYDYNDKLTRTTDTAIGSNLVYDSFGRMTTVGNDTITYNSYGAPITVSDGSNTVAYTRLASLGIIEKATTTSSGTTTIRYSAGGLVLDTNNNPINQTANFGPVTATFAISSGSTQFQLNTLSGHRLLTMSSTGTLTGSSPVLFDPYGVQIQPAVGTTPDGSVPNYAWMAGAAQESEDVALPYVMMGARVYLPSLGLFTSPDPKPTGGLTPYNYAISDPINNIDPDGLSWKSNTHWMRKIFWKDSLKWAFGAHEPKWHYVVTGIVLAIVVVAVCYFACASLMAVFASSAPSTMTTTAVEASETIDAVSVESNVSPLVENLDAGGDAGGSVANAAPNTGPYDQIIDPLQEPPSGVGQTDPNAGYFDDIAGDSSDDDDDPELLRDTDQMLKDMSQRQYNMDGQLQGRLWQMSGRPIPDNPFSALVTTGTSAGNVSSFNAGFYAGVAAALPK